MSLLSPRHSQLWALLILGTRMSVSGDVCTNTCRGKGPENIPPPAGLAPRARRQHRDSTAKGCPLHSSDLGGHSAERPLWGLTSLIPRELLLNWGSGAEPCLCYSCSCVTATTWDLLGVYLTVWTLCWPQLPSPGLPCPSCLGTVGWGPGWWSPCPAGHVFTLGSLCLREQPAFAIPWCQCCGTCENTSADPDPWSLWISILSLTASLFFLPKYLLPFKNKI